jgi:hypothetical protein
MPLEAVRYDLTPPGHHYLVAHWDIPELDPARFRLGVGGRVRRPLELTLDDLRARPARTIPVTLECAGNGRGWLEPRPVSLPWLGEAIATAEWTARRSGSCSQTRVSSARRSRSCSAVPTPGSRARGADVRTEPQRRGGDASRGAPRLRDERASARAATRLPAPAHRPRLVRDDEREMTHLDRGRRRAVPGLPAGHRVPLSARRRRHGRARPADARPGDDDPARDPRLRLATSPRRRRTHRAYRPRLVGARAGETRRGGGGRGMG